MANKQPEQISAYIDNELNSDEQRFLCRHLANNEQARRDLIRVYETQAALHRERVDGASVIADRVQAALSAEASHSLAEQPTPRLRLSPIFQPLAGLAIAASVALALVAIWPVANVIPSAPSAPSTSSVATAPSASMLSPTFPLSPVGSQSAASPLRAPANEETRQQLSPYLINHSEYSAIGQLGGTLQFARIVGYEDEQ